MAPAARIFLTLSVAAACLWTTGASPVLASATPEVRGTWLTTTANDHLATPGQTANTMRQLRALGLNTVYVECWKNGYTQFPSPTLKYLIDAERHPSLIRPAPPHRDLLEEALIEAHRNQLLCIAWFEYGFMAAHEGTDNPLRRVRPEWLSRDIDGNAVAPNGFVWLNPLHPDVRQLLVGIILDAAERYDLDGIQLDDRLAWPHYTMGYDDFTREVYAQEHDGRQPPDDPHDPDWLNWRAEKVTEAACMVYETVRRARPDLLISVSPSPYPWSYENYAVDWPRWAEAGWFDEFVPQVYRESFAAFEPEWLRQVEHAGERRGDLVAGIRIVGSGPDTSWEDLRSKIELARRSGAGGHSLWFSRGVLDVYAQELARFYDVAGQHAPHPKRAADWRPAPVVAEHHGRDEWRVNVPVAGRYRIIARRGQMWSEVRSDQLRAGGQILRVPAADAVELLRDRRGGDVAGNAAR